jgi:hypothetical protein
MANGTSEVTPPLAHGDDFRVLVHHELDNRLDETTLHLLSGLYGCEMNANLRPTAWFLATH